MKRRHMASITEGATGYPGNFGSIPKSAALISEVLKQNGYNTFAQGKWHLTPYTATTAAGPFDRWPTGQGFEKYYGFIDGETDQWASLQIGQNMGTPVSHAYTTPFPFGGDIEKVTIVFDQRN